MPNHRDEIFIPLPHQYAKYIHVVQNDSQLNFSNRLEALKSEQSRIHRVLIEKRDNKTILFGELAYYDKLKKYGEWLDAEIRVEEAIDVANHAQQPENILHDLPEVDKLRVNEKIILLNELGILDSLLQKHPAFRTSTNLLAGYLARLTSERQTTLQPYLNALLSDTNAEDKNPYRNTKAVNSIKEMLSKNGITPNSR